MPENPIADVGKALEKKGPGGVPVYVWAGVAVIGGLAVYYVFFRASSAEPATGSVGLGNVLPPTLGGSGGGTTGGVGGTASSDSTTKEPLTNPVWLTTAIPAVVKALGMDPARVGLYLREYLAGRMPVGNSTAQNDFSRVVQAALQAVGQPGSPPTLADVNSNPFLSNIDWLNNALGFLPSGTPGSVRQELINFFNGNATSISQAAADALEGTRGILGYEPRILPYTIIPTAVAPSPGTTPPPTPAAPTPAPVAPITVAPAPVAPAPVAPTPVAPAPVAPAPSVPPALAPPPVASAIDRNNAWAKAINNAFVTYYGRPAADQEIWDYAAKMASGAVKNIEDAVRQAHLDESPNPGINVSSGWGKLINDLFRDMLYRNATQSEIYGIADQMQRTTLTTAQIRNLVAGYRLRGAQ